MGVDTKIAAVDKMAKNWAIVSPLIGGTLAMREQGEKLLPKFPQEEDKSYKDRLEAATLFPAYTETVSNMTGRVFAEALTFDSDLKTPWEEWVKDIDNEGNKLDVWAEDVFNTGLGKGLVHAFVEYPKTDGLETIKEAQQAGVRPYVIKIDPEQVLGWRSEKGELTQFRYMEAVTEEDGDFGVKTVEQIRVLEPGTWTTYRKKDSDWVVYDSGTSLEKEIPIATFYTGRTGYMTAKPPLLELGHLNVKHWRSESDQDNITHVARVPILVLKSDDNTGEDGKDRSIQIGTGSVVQIGSEDELKYVEHTGASIEAGANSLDKLKMDMREAGAKLTTKDRSGNKTATEVEEDKNTETSPLQRMSGQFEDFLNNVLRLFGEWSGETLEQRVTVNGNFNEDYLPELSVPTLLQARLAGEISGQTYFEEMQRRGVLSHERTFEDEQERLQEDGPPTGDLTDEA